MQASMNSIKHLWNHVLIHDTPCHPIHNWSLQAVQNINIPSPFYSPHAVSKYLCSFLWCAFSRVSTGTLSWLEGTLHALQRINIRTSMSRATRMLHAMATTAAVDSPVVEAESSRSHSCIADTETAFLPQTSCQPQKTPLWSVTREAQRFKALLVDVTITLLSLLVTQGSSDRLIGRYRGSVCVVWNKCVLLFTILCHRSRTHCVLGWRKSLERV